MLDDAVNLLHADHHNSLYYNQVQGRNFCAIETLHKQKRP